MSNVLIAMNVAIHVADFCLPGNPLLKWGLKENRLIRSGQWWRIGTCMFLHGGWLHLAVCSIMPYLAHRVTAPRAV